MTSKHQRGRNVVLQPVSVATTKKEIIEDLCHRVADIKYDLQVVLDTLYQLENEYDEKHI